MSIQWGRVLLTAFLMEIILIAIAVPLSLGGAGRVLVYVIPPTAFIATFGVTVWLGRGINSQLVLHGVLIGIVGTLMYMALTRAQPEPWQYWLAHGLKIAGGAAGGMLLASRRAAGNALPSAP
ncbi:MAG TPA: hypothetical protein VHV99_07910 [Paraburkholderia sp.]|nr:hypothetical protein [Paraburkholderia sp.]